MSNTNNIRTVLNIMSNTYNGLQIIHLNARSLTSHKLDYLKYILCNTKVDVVCITETWFRPELVDGIVEIPNFSCTRLDRRNGLRGGGIAFYCKKGIKITTKLQSSSISSVEFFGIELQGQNHRKCLIIAVYNPSRTNNLDTFFGQLKTISPAYEDIVICADFNINLLRNDLLAERFCDDVTACGLYIVNKYPTRFAPNCNPALLDIMMCSNKSQVIHIDQLSIGGVSDHELLFYVHDMDLHCESYGSFSYHDFNAIDIVALFTDCSTVNWNTSWYYGNVNCKIEVLTLQILKVFNAHVPLKTKMFKQSKPPWFQKDVKLAIKIRNNLYCKWKSDPSTSNWEFF